MLVKWCWGHRGWMIIIMMMIIQSDWSETIDQKLLFGYNQSDTLNRYYWFDTIDQIQSIRYFRYYWFDTIDRIQSIRYFRYYWFDMIDRIQSIRYFRYYWFDTIDRIQSIRYFRYYWFDTIDWIWLKQPKNFVPWMETPVTTLFFYLLNNKLKTKFICETHVQNFCLFHVRFGMCLGSNSSSGLGTALDVAVWLKQMNYKIDSNTITMVKNRISEQLCCIELSEANLWH